MGCVRRHLLATAFAVLSLGAAAQQRDSELTVADLRQLPLEQLAEVALADMDAFRRAIEGMSVDELEALANEIANSFHESYRVMLALETSSLELRHLTSEKGLARSNPDVREFLALDPQSDDVDKFVASRTVEELETLGDALIDYFDDNLEFARRVELNAMEQMMFLRELQFSPNADTDPRCDPGYWCRQGCYARKASCATAVAQIASDCAQAARRHRNACVVGNPTEAQRCVGEEITDLLVCSAQETSNGQQCGQAFVGCTECCANYGAYLTCWGEFADVSLNEDLLPFHAH